MSLRIDRISKRFNDKWALRDVSVEVAAGEILALFGPSGSGKSAFIRIVAGQEGCNGGSIFHDGNDVTKFSREDRNFHTPSLANESVWRGLFKTNKNPQLADGVEQALALDNALTNAEKGVLLLDNSFCDMDRQMQLTEFEKIRNVVKERNLAVIYACNDYDDVFALADRVAVLVKGEIKQVGTPQEVYDSPNSATVAGLVGQNNLFAARRLTSSKADLPEFFTIDGEHRLFTQKASVGSLGPINQNATLAIRPENISISFGASFPEDNLLKAKVVKISPKGPTTLLKLDSNGLLLDVLVLRLVGLDIGDECMIGLPPDRIMVLRD
jgi:ABC-type Fe3+/spermidine/putrescine transport system ATPase subunit